MGWGQASLSPDDLVKALLDVVFGVPNGLLLPECIPGKDAALVEIGRFEIEGLAAFLLVRSLEPGI